MQRGKVMLATQGLDQKRTARYIQYRAYLHNPLVVACDPVGEWTHHSRRGPAKYDLSVEGGVVGVVVTGSVVELRYKGDPAKTLCDYLTHDPIWGPDWQYEARTRG